MNKLEEQLDYLNHEVEQHMVKPRRGAIGGSVERGYMVCSCSSENFINYSSNQWLTRASFVSTWLIGFNAAENNKQFFEKYNFLIYGFWIKTPHQGKRQIFIVI